MRRSDSRSGSRPPTETRASASACSGPAGVHTPFLKGKASSPQARDAITTDQLADIVLQALAEEPFLISTHQFVLDKFAIKARDYEEYIRTMRADRAAADAADAVPV